MIVLNRSGLNDLGYVGDYTITDNEFCIDITEELNQLYLYVKKKDRPNLTFAQFMQKAGAFHAEEETIKNENGKYYAVCSLGSRSMNGAMRMIVYYEDGDYYKSTYTEKYSVLIKDVDSVSDANDEAQ